MPPTTIDNSDSEDDTDYVPPADDHDSDSSDDPVENSNTVGTAPPDTDADTAEQKKQREALWASFQASVSTPSNHGTGTGTGTGNATSSQVKRVKIAKTYLFAGKYITDVVEVAEGSEEATKWPLWSPRPRSPDAASARASSSTPCADAGKGEEEQGKGDSPAPPPAVDPDAASSTTAPSTPGASKRPGPRKPRTALPPVPKASQAKKITTLDKSAMDWRAHVAAQSSDVKGELDANRRGGGYLEKVDFLKRVEDRREDAFEASKSSKRRKT